MCRLLRPTPLEENDAYRKQGQGLRGFEIWSVERRGVGMYKKV
jgi:hypothetical protein